VDKIALQVTLNETDWNAYILEATLRARAASETGLQRILRWVPTAFILALAGLTVVAYATSHYGRVALAALVAVSLFTWTLRLVVHVSQKPMEGGIFLGSAEVEFDSHGMRLRKPTYQCFTAWTHCAEVTDTPTHIFIWIDRFTAQVIPLRDLPPGMTAPEFLTAVRGFISNRTTAASALIGEPTRDGTAEVGPAAEPQVAARPGTLAELGQLFRLFVLTDARPSLLYGRDVTIALLGMLALASFVLLERFEYGVDAQFYPYSLAGLAWFAVVALALSWVLARLSGISFRRLLLLVAGLGFVASLVFGVGNLFGAPGMVAAYAVVMVETFVFLGRGMTLLAGRPRRLAFTAGVLLLTGCWYVSDRLFLTPSFWMSPEAGMEAEEQAWSDRDQLAYGQSLRVDAALKSLSRAEGASSQMFFLGFAGYGDQRVFAEEISMAAARVDDRYGTAGRSLQLVNDRRHPEALPWASVPALRHALLGVAKVMDVERDVLFLSLSSHGSEDATLSVNDGMPFSRDLESGELAKMLRESGIRWKVVVISACHSGSFVDDLRDEFTVVLTAAAKDRTSFGCSDDRELTYFGEAFYRDALPGAPDLRSAFETARAALAAREEAEGIRPSNPQAHFGAQIELKLAELDPAP
jgi:hypothetical protein